MRGVAVIGNLARDTVDGGAPRVGGAPYHAARALRHLGGRTRIVARCAAADRRTLLAPLVALGVPVTWVEAPATAAFALRYDGEERAVEVVEPGAPWTVEEALRVGRAEWIHVGALTRGEFPPEVLTALGRDRRIALDGQALVRPGQAGPLVPDGDFDPALLGCVRVLKLAEAEAEVLGGIDAVRQLGVPEVLVTLGSRGATLLSGDTTEHVPVRRLPGRVDPTGAGDAFLASYVWGRASGHRPLSAARHAAAATARALELAAAPVAG